MKKLFFASEKLCLSLWVGAAWMTGAVVAPVTFQVLANQRVLAGTLAGKLFSVISYAGLVVTAILAISILLRLHSAIFRSLRFYLIVTMGTLLAINQFVLHPMIAAARQQSATAQTLAQQSFATLHQLASIGYVSACIIGFALMIDRLRCNTT